MTEKQAKAATNKVILQSAEWFRNNDECKELWQVLQNEQMAIGLARLLLQASWKHFTALGTFADCYRDAAYMLLYQFYRRQKPKRKTKSKK